LPAERVSRKAETAQPASRLNAAATAWAASTAGVAALQRQFGNRAVSRLLAEAAPGGLLVQTKLTVGPARDAFEEEADQAARRVLAGEGGRAPLAGEHGKSAPSIRRAAAQAEPGSGPALGPAAEAEIEGARGRGHRLPPGLQAKLNKAFGMNLSGVKVHADGQADRISRSLQARAFTTGSDIFFKQGEFKPGSRQGEELIAHEMAHVVQQSGAPARRGGTIQRRVLTIGDPQLEKTTTKEFQRANFLGQETDFQQRQAPGGETFHQIADKWGDMGMHKLNPLRLIAKKYGWGAYGPRRSFQPGTGQQYLENMPAGEDLKIIAHGSLGQTKVAGYTPEKLANVLAALGLEPGWNGRIWMHSCLAGVRRTPGGMPDEVGDEGTSFIERMHAHMRKKGFNNQILGLRGIIMAGSNTEMELSQYEQREKHEEAEQAYNKAKAKSDKLWDKKAMQWRQQRAQNQKKQRREELDKLPRGGATKHRAWYTARPYEPMA
jgi:hypothetical protein